MNDRRDGVAPRQPMRVIDAGATHIRHATSSPDAEGPGHRGLYRRHVGDDHDVPVGRLRRPGHSARLPHPDPEVHERLAPRRRPVGIRAPRGPRPGRHLGERDAVQLAVVQLDPALVDVEPGRRRPPRPPPRRSPGTRPAGWSRPGRRPARRTPGQGSRPGARPSSSSGGSSRPSSSPRRWPRCGRGETTITPSHRTTDHGVATSRSSWPVRRKPLAAGRLVEPEAAPAPPQGGRARQLQHDVERAAGQLGQLGVAPGQAGERPPEHLGVGPDAVEQQVHEHADRDATSRRCTRRRRGVSSMARPAAPRPPQACAGPGAHRAAARPAGAAHPASPAGSRRPGCGTRATRATNAPPANQRNTGSAGQSRTRRRPHSSQCTELVDAGSLRMRSTSTAESVRWQPWQVGADQAGDRRRRRAGRRSRSYSGQQLVGDRGGGLGPLACARRSARPRSRPRPRPARRSSRRLSASSRPARPSARARSASTGSASSMISSSSSSSWR